MAPASMMSSIISVQVPVATPQACQTVRFQARSFLLVQQSRYFVVTIVRRSSLFSNYSIMVSGAVSVQPPLGDIPCYFRLSAQVNTYFLNRKL